MISLLEGILSSDTQPDQESLVVVVVLLGTWVNEVRLQPGVQWELSDGDALTFGGQSAPGSPEFYFLFQKVKVRPLDFDAITIPKVIFVFIFKGRLK